ncbi:hypothetical protein V8F20_012024 [Naviculisporaceae sp. PSN 640]
MPIDDNHLTDPGVPLQEFLEENDGARLTTSSVILMVLTTCLIGLRFLSDNLGRKHRSRKWFLDDIIILFSYVCFMTLCAIMIAMVAVGGMGTHVYALSIKNPAALDMFTRLVTPCLVFLYFLMSFPRLAILSLYLRVFNWRRGGWAYSMTVVLMALVVIVFILSVSISVAVCRPVGFAGDISMANGDCIHYYWFFRSQMFIGILFDFGLMALPCKTIWSMPMPVAKRMTGVVFFLCASLGMVGWIITRVVVSYAHAPWIDGTYSAVSLNIWYSSEGAYLIMINCLSRLRPLMLVILPERLIEIWRRTMTSCGRFLRAPDNELEVLPISGIHNLSPKKGRNNSHNSPVNEHRAWDEETGGPLEEIDLGALRRPTTRGHHPVSLSFMEDPYMLGPNSRTIGVSSWTIVGPSEERPVKGRNGGSSSSEGTGEIQVTVEVSMRTNPRTSCWTLHE